MRVYAHTHTLLRTLIGHVGAVCNVYYIMCTGEPVLGGIDRRTSMPAMPNKNVIANSEAEKVEGVL